MKQGHSWRLPERPADMRTLWNEAQPIEATTLPTWLESADAGYFRCLGRVRRDMMNPEQWALCQAELALLEERGFIVDRESWSEQEPAVFMKQPRQDAVWSIGIYSGSSPLDLRPAAVISQPVLRAEDVTDVPAEYVADPFLWRDPTGAWRMFFEVMNWQSWKGEIGLACSSDGLVWNYQQIVLSESFHLSYPYIIPCDSDLFMIPECFQSGSVRLYRASIHDPTHWTAVATLLEGDYLVDASPWHQDGRRWMLVDASPTQAHDTLRLFHAAALKGPWSEHPLSPLLSQDPRHARPAGRIIRWGNRTIRLAQNSEPDYGTDVRAFEIITLTPTNYHEIPIHPIPLLGPTGVGWNARGMHHVDVHEIKPGAWLAAVDGWTYDSA